MLIGRPILVLPSNVQLVDFQRTFLITANIGRIKPPVFIFSFLLRGFKLHLACLTTLSAPTLPSIHTHLLNALNS